MQNNYASVNINLKKNIKVFVLGKVIGGNAVFSQARIVLWAVYVFLFLFFTPYTVMPSLAADSGAKANPELLPADQNESMSAEEKLLLEDIAALRLAAEKEYAEKAAVEQARIDKQKAEAEKARIDREKTALAKQIQESAVMDQAPKQNVSYRNASEGGMNSTKSEPERSKPVKDMPKTGQIFPDFKVTTDSGQHISFEQYQGKVLVVDFSATDCLTCRDNTPYLIELNNKYGRQGLKIISMNSDRDLRQAPDKNPSDNLMSYPVAKIDQETQDEFGVKVVPVIFVVDMNGRVAGVFRSIDNESRSDIENLIKKLLTRLYNLAQPNFRGDYRNPSHHFPVYE